MPLQFDKLILSRRQPVLPNDDPADPSERFFSTEGIQLLQVVDGMVRRLSELDKTVQTKFWEGQVPAELLEFLPA